MPYIKQNAKDELNTGRPIQGPGELNYLITMLCKRYWVNGPRTYQSINDIVGALEGAKLEFVRRIVNRYEDAKIHENGDCYDTEPAIH